MNLHFVFLIRHTLRMDMTGQLSQLPYIYSNSQIHKYTNTKRNSLESITPNDNRSVSQTPAPVQYRSCSSRTHDSGGNLLWSDICFRARLIPLPWLRPFGENFADICLLAKKIYLPEPFKSKNWGNWLKIFSESFCHGYDKAWSAFDFERQTSLAAIVLTSQVP